MWRGEDLRKFGALGWPERRLLVEAVLRLGFARVVLLVIPFRWTTRLYGLRPCDTASPANPETSDAARRVGWAIGAAARRTPWQSACLAQALAGVAMLRRRRIPATVVLGVAKDSTETAGLTAHAWLSSGGTILTGMGGHKRFSVVATFISGIA